MKFNWKTAPLIFIPVMIARNSFARIYRYRRNYKSFYLGWLILSGIFVGNDYFYLLTLPLFILLGVAAARENNMAFIKKSLVIALLLICSGFYLFFGVEFYTVILGGNTSNPSRTIINYTLADVDKYVPSSVVFANGTIMNNTYLLHIIPPTNQYVNNLAIEGYYILISIIIFLLIKYPTTFTAFSKS